MTDEQTIKDKNGIDAIKDCIDEIQKIKVTCESDNTYTIQSTTENRNHPQYQYFELTQIRVQISDHVSKSIISKDGFFYNKFDCHEFNWVERIHDSDYYVCKKKEKYGIIDGKGNIVIDIVYPLITILPKPITTILPEIVPCWHESSHINNDRKEILSKNIDQYIVLKITTYDGEYLMEITSMHKSKIYDKIYTFGENYLIENKELYGFLSPLGDEIVPPKYPKAYPITMKDELFHVGNADFRSYLEGNLNGRKVLIPSNGKYYGKIPLIYEDCIRMSDWNGCREYYLVKKNGKYGLINYFANELYEYIPISYVSIEFDIHQPFYGYSRNYAIVQNENGYQLFDIVSKKTTGELYQSIKYTYSRNLRTYNSPYYDHARPYEPFFIAEKDNKFGILSPSGMPLTDFIYQTISPMFNSVFPVCKDTKWGIIDEWGKQLIECEWDKVENIGRNWATLYKDGRKTIVKLKTKVNSSDCDYSSIYECPTYERYAGTYAQDEMGYSDDEIDTIFDGDPSAYWNID